MAKYVDGYVIPLPKKNIESYRKMARKAGKVWMEHGALEYRECVGEDLKVKKVRPFGRAADAKAGETVLFSWIVYKSKKDRDAINKKVMADPRLAKMMKDVPPFDVKRMVFGGFDVIVEF